MDKEPSLALDDIEGPVYDALGVDMNVSDLVSSVPLKSTRCVMAGGSARQCKHIFACVQASKSEITDAYRRLAMVGCMWSNVVERYEAVLPAVWILAASLHLHDAGVASRQAPRRRGCQDHLPGDCSRISKCVVLRHASAPNQSRLHGVKHNMMRPRKCMFPRSVSCSEQPDIFCCMCSFDEPSIA
jgi:hypothetical protein